MRTSVGFEVDSMMHSPAHTSRRAARAMGEGEREHAEPDQDAAFGVAGGAYTRRVATETSAEASPEQGVHAVGAQTERDVDQAEDECLRPDRPVLALDELRQERQEEQGDLRVQQADDEPLGEQLLRRPQLRRRPSPDVAAQIATT